MLEKAKRWIRLLSRLKKRRGNEPPTMIFPYKYQEALSGMVFNINNSIEAFRLQHWGGEKEYVETILKELVSDDVFFDIGSSVGLVSVLVANALKKGTVISFEPDPENLVRLKENYAVNHLQNFLIQPIAVGEVKSKMKLYTAGSNAFSPSLQKVNGIEHSIEVDINTIDNLIADGVIPYPTVIKIDIEGAEMMALKGMTSLLNNDKRPRLIFIEFHPDFLPAFNTSLQEIYNFLSVFEYDIIENEVRNQQILCTLRSK